MAKLERTVPLKINGLPVGTGTITKDTSTGDLKLVIFDTEMHIPEGNKQIIWASGYATERVVGETDEQ